MPPQTEQNSSPTSPAPVQSPVPRAPSGVKNLKSKIIILIIFIIFVAGLKYQLLVESNLVPQYASEPTSQTDPTQGWKTYRNDQYGFEFKYPAEWVDANRSLNIKDFFIKIPNIGVFGIDVLRENATAKEVALKEITQNNCPKEDMLLNSTNRDALYILSCGATSESYIYIVETATSTFIRLDYHDDFDSSWSVDQKLKTFNQILSTFKFITPQASTTVDTSNWKTYTNNQYGFEFEYPSHLVLSKDSKNDNICFNSTDPNNSHAVTYFPCDLQIIITDTSQPIGHTESSPFSVTNKSEKNLSLGSNEWTLTVKDGPSIGKWDLTIIHGIYLIDVNVTNLVDVKTSDMSEEVNQILSTFKFTK